MRFPLHTVTATLSALLLCGCTSSRDAMLGAAEGQWEGRAGDGQTISLTLVEHADLWSCYDVLGESGCETDSEVHRISVRVELAGPCAQVLVGSLAEETGHLSLTGATRGDGPVPASYWLSGHLDETTGSLVLDEYLASHACPVCGVDTPSDIMSFGCVQPPSKAELVAQGESVRLRRVGSAR